MDLNTRTKKLIINSLFLDQKRKLKLIEFLGKSDEQECAGLSKVLEEEKLFFADLLRNFIGSGGQPALDYLNSGFSQISKLTNKTCEKHDRGSEDENCEKLLENLNDTK